MTKIVFLDALSMGDTDLTSLNEFGELLLFPETKPEQTGERLAGCSIAISNKVPVRREHLQNSSVKLVCLPSTGTNTVDAAACREFNIAVTNVPDYSSATVAQHTFAMLLYLMENIRYYDDYVRSGRYVKAGIFTHLGMPIGEIQGKTWGILGLGNIGRRVADLAAAFGAEVIYHSVSGEDRSRIYRRVSREELFEKSDILSVHCPLTEKTRGYAGKDEISSMKKTAFFLNLARGGIADEAALADAVSNGDIAGAGLDVLSQEPMSEESPLFRIKEHPSLLITPHIAWGSHEARERLLEEMKKNIRAFLAGEKRNRVV